jgi:hypothetical protein
VDARILLFLHFAHFSLSAVIANLVTFQKIGSAWTEVGLKERLDVIEGDLKSFCTLICNMDRIILSRSLEKQDGMCGGFPCLIFIASCSWF